MSTLADIELLTCAEAARVLRLSQRTVRRLVAAGELPGQRFGKSYRIDAAELEARLVPRRHMTNPTRRK